MTACLAADNDRDADFFREHLALVDGTGMLLHWVSAFCDQRHLVECAQRPGRVQSSKMKLTDLEILQQLVNTHRLLKQKLLKDGLSNLIVGSLNTMGKLTSQLRFC